MRLRNPDYEDEKFAQRLPPELEQQDYTPVDAPPAEEVAPVEEPAPVSAPVPQPSREDLLRRVLEKQAEFDAQREQRLARAAKQDRKAQSEADVREYLRAAFTRSAPQLRQVGKSYTEEASAAGNQGPLSRELALQKVLAGYKSAPFEAEKERLTLAKLRKDLEPKSGKPPLSPEERAYWEKIAGKPLPPGATEDDVGRLGAFVRSENSLEQSRNQFGTRLAEDRANRAAEESRREEGMEIPGWDRNPKIRVTSQEVSEMRDGIAATKVLNEEIDGLIAAIKKHGVKVNPRSEGYGEIKARLSGVKLRQKAPSLEALGVLAGPDMDILKDLTGEPDSLAGLFRGADDAIARLTVSRERAGINLRAKMGSRGYAKGSGKTYLLVGPDGKKYHGVKREQVDELMHEPDWDQWQMQEEAAP